MNPVDKKLSYHTTPWQDGFSKWKRKWTETTCQLGGHSNGWKICCDYTGFVGYRPIMDTHYTFTWGWHCIMYNPCNINEKLKIQKNLCTIGPAQSARGSDKTVCGNCKIAFTWLCMKRRSFSLLDCNDGWNMGPFVSTWIEERIKTMASPRVIIQEKFQQQSGKMKIILLKLSGAPFVLS